MFFNTYIESAKKIIDSAKVISFDIFDTLLIRPYISPKDLFVHLEKEYSLEGFAQARIAAEKRARKSNSVREDIKIDEIYSEIDENFKHVKSLELEWEFKVLVANPELKMIWDYAKQKNKEVIIISDMYLSSEFLNSVLSKNGFAHYEHLYVSGDYGKTKKTGALFKQVLSDLNVQANEIAHFGDNRKGDYAIPKKLGINCLLYTQIIQQFLSQDNHAKIVNEQSVKNLGNSILISLLAWRWQKISLGLIEDHYWSNIGYSYAAPLAYGYSRWIEHTAQNLDINHLLFAARDGYLLQKVFKSFNSSIKTTYAYVPRFLNLTCRLQYEPNNAQQIDAILSFFSEKYYEIKQLNNIKELQTIEEKSKFLQEYHSVFEKYANYEFEHYKAYIQSKTSDDANLAVIDTKTIAFTAQRLLESSLSKKITGLYWSTILQSKINDFKYFEFLPNNFPYYDSKIFSHNWKFIEVLLSSPEYPIKGINEFGNAIYDENPSQEEINLRVNFEHIEQGVDQFLEDVQNIFGKSNLFFEGYALIEWINIFCEHPTTADIENIAEIQQATDVSHQNYQPIFSYKITLKDFLIHPKRSIYLAKKSLWKTGTQTVLLNIFKPLKIKRKNGRSFEISLFPYLQRQYFVFWLVLFANIQLKLTIGSFNLE